VDYRKLELKDDVPTKTDYENIPEQRGGGAPLIPPGRYGFEIPKNVADAWATQDATVGQRVRVKFDRDHPLVLVKAVKKSDEPLIGEVWEGGISNAERNRARKGDPERLVSDMTYLLRDGLGSTGRPSKNREFIEEFNKFAGAQFTADNEWSASCNEKNTRYILVDGQAIEDPDGRKGCGTRVYQSDLQRDAEGYYLERQNCPKCGASIRCFQNLTRFGKLE
jgi:hypothetical protein